MARLKGKPKKKLNKGAISNGALSAIGTRGLGAKGKIEYNAPKQCDYYIGGKERLIKRYRKSPPYDAYFVTIVVGGKRCWNEALAYSTAPTNKKARCTKHLSSVYEPEDKKSK